MSSWLGNTRNTCFLKLAAPSVRDVNLQLDENSISYGRTYIVIRGMGLNKYGQRKVGQLTLDLQKNGFKASCDARSLLRCCCTEQINKVAIMGR